jgi:hypothetical protein
VQVFSFQEDQMNRREFVIGGTAALVAAALATACSKEQQQVMTGPSTPTPGAPGLFPQVTINPNMVGPRAYSVGSPRDGSLYYDVFRLLPLAISTDRFGVDRVTGAVLNGFAVVSVNGDRGLAMVNVLGERAYAGWVIAIGNNHLFYNSIMDVYVKSGDVIDFYHALPCSNPNLC